MRRNNFTILLKIRHPSADPEVFTKMLGIDPECCWKAGEIKRDGHTKLTRRESYWVAEVPARPAISVRARSSFARGKVFAGQSEAIDWSRLPWFRYDAADIPVEGVLMLVALLFANRRESWATLRTEGATAQVIVVFGPNPTPAFDLPHEVMSLLSQSGLSISIDFRDAAEEAAA